MMNENYAVAITTALKSGNVALRDVALRQLRDAFLACRGNAVHAARYMGVSHRSLLRWCASDSAVLGMLNDARDGKVKS